MSYMCIIEILKRHLPFSGQEGLQELKKIAVRFEEKIYTAATNQVFGTSLWIHACTHVCVVCPHFLTGHSVEVLIFSLILLTSVLFRVIKVLFKYKGSVQIANNESIHK